MADQGADIPQKRRYTRVNGARHAEMVRLKARGKSYEEIADRIGVSECTVSRVLSRPVTQAEVAELSKRLGLDRQAIRDRQKEILITRTAAMTERACDLVEGTIEDGNAKD